MTPAGIETTTFRFVAQHLNHCATAVPSATVVLMFSLYSVGPPDIASVLKVVLGNIWGEKRKFYIDMVAAVSIIQTAEFRLLYAGGYKNFISCCGKCFDRAVC